MPQSILDQYADQQGWNDRTKIILLCNYIANQQCNDVFDDFLAQQADEENEENEG